MIRNRLARTLTASLALAAAFGSAEAAAAVLDERLASRLAAASPTDELEIIVSYEHSGAPTAADLALLKSLGIERGIAMRSLPIVGALATPAEIRALAARDDVASVYANEQLEYYNLEARQISGVEKAQAEPLPFGRPVPYTGHGVTAMINDSGVDATHADLQYGNHVVANVQGLTNLRALDSTLSFLPNTWLEGTPNTDTNSGHGTHCAGTLGGTGARSNGKYKGVAPGADLVGYGSGAAIAILDGIGGFDYAIQNQTTFANPIRVISNSWGSRGKFDPLHPINIASYEAYKKGIVVLFAAGNDGSGEDTHNPYAQAPWVISVGAARKGGELEPFSSRGARFESGTFTMPDGQTWTYRNEPTIVATGVDVVSTRAVTNVGANGADADLAIEPAFVPFYTMISGTSMATPHVAGIATLLLEANPNLTPLQVKEILAKTATNMSSKEAWEVGAGHVNAHAALAMATRVRTDFGATVNTLRTFNANATVTPGAEFPFSVDYSPLGTTGAQTFEVGPGTAWITASANVPTNTVAVVLVAPDGTEYGSAISLPELGSSVSATAPATPGTWKVTVSGIGSVSGVGVDPLGVTNGVALPGNVSGTIRFTESGGYTGLNDIAAHPAKGAIEYAVSRRLVDGRVGGTFAPDASLTRAELAEYLVMGGSIRQQLPLNGTPSFTDLAKTNRVYPFAESVVSKGGALRDLTLKQDPVVPLSSGKFAATSAVNRLGLAYSLVQSLALQDEARAYTGDVKATYDGQQITVSDNAQIPANLRGYAQVALDLGLIIPKFSLTQGPFDLQPTIHAAFAPNTAVTRAEFAVSIARFADGYLVVE